MKTLKKIFLLVLVAAVVSLSLAGCSKKTEEAPSEHPTEEHPTEEHPTD